MGARVLFIAGHSGPSIFPDEIGYWGNARSLAGAAALPNMFGHPYYHFGYSLLIAPLFALPVEPRALYRLVLFENCLLLSSVFFPLYLLLRRAFGEGRRVAAIIALATTSYPAFALNPAIAWSENAFIPLFAWTLLAFLALVERPTCARGLLVAACVVSLYAVHPRGVGMLPVTTLMLLAMMVSRRLAVRDGLLAIALLAVGIFLVKKMDAHLLQQGYNAVTVTSGGAAQQLKTKLGIAAIATFLGHLTYVGMGTFGLAIAGSLALLRVWLLNLARLRHFFENPQAALSMYALLCAGGIAAVAATFLALGLRADHALYGRYNEGWIAFFIAVGLLQLVRWQRGDAPAGWAILGGACLTATLTCITWLIEHERRLPLASSDVHWLGVVAFWQLFGRPQFLWIGLGCACVGLLAGCLARRWPLVAVGGVGIIFLGEAMVAREAIHPAHYKEDAEPGWATHLRSHPEVKEISFDTSEGNTRPILTTQFLFPHLRVHSYNSRFGQTPPTALFVASERGGRRLELECEVVASGPAGQALYSIDHSPSAPSNSANER